MKEGRAEAMASADGSLVWEVRAFVYRHFVETTRPPTVHETAAAFDLTANEVAALFQDLHQRHALFLEPGTVSVRMANPFSAIPTPFRVHVRGKAYWANCAWDSLGIPATLHCDATIETECADSGIPVTLTVRDGRVTHQGELVHFLVPFRRWYEDLVFT
jgi:hypothetical protein